MRNTTPSLTQHRLIDYVDKTLHEHAANWRVEMAEEIARQFEERIAHTGHAKIGMAMHEQVPPLPVWNDMASTGSAWQHFNDLGEALTTLATRLSSFEKRLCCTEEALGAVQAMIPEALAKNSSCKESLENVHLKNTTINDTILEELRRLQDVIGAILVTTTLRYAKPTARTPESPDLRWLHNVEPVGLCNSTGEERRNLRIGVQSVPLPRHSHTRAQSYLSGRLDDRAQSPEPTPR